MFTFSYPRVTLSIDFWRLLSKKGQDLHHMLQAPLANIFPFVCYFVCLRICMYLCVDYSENGAPANNSVLVHVRLVVSFVALDEVDVADAWPAIHLVSEHYPVLFVTLLSSRSCSDCHAANLITLSIWSLLWDFYIKTYTKLSLQNTQSTLSVYLTYFSSIRYWIATFWE